MATREFELVVAASCDAIVEDFYGAALVEWNPELAAEDAEVEDDLPVGWKVKTPAFAVSVALEGMGESTAMTVTIEAGLLKVGGWAKEQRERFAKLRIRAENRAG